MRSNQQQIIANVRRNLADNQIELALVGLGSILPATHSLHREWLLHQSNWDKLAKDGRSGGLSPEELNRAYRANVRRLIDLVYEVEAQLDQTENNQAVTAIDENQIRSLIYLNIFALNQQDIDLVARTLHPDLPNLDQHLQVNQDSFVLELVYVIDDIRVEEVNHELNLATVIVEQVTLRTNPETPFADNRGQVIHVLKKHENTWRLFSTRVKQIIYLDEEEVQPYRT